MSTFAVLGTGLVGRLIARDLAGDAGARVSAWDASDDALARLRGIDRIETHRADLATGGAVREAVSGASVVVVALPGFMGGTALRTVLESGRPVVDISFSPGDPFDLDPVATRAGVPAIVDCGVAPGLSNLFVGRSIADLDVVDRVLILVGGLPSRRVLPFEYKLVFSLADVLEEYTRPSRFREAGVEVVKPALSEVEWVDLPRVGTLEAFNTDGLRTLLRTVAAPDLREKTLRWPGHADRMRLLRDAGFLDEDPVVVGGSTVRPRAMAEVLLRRVWDRPDDEEFTVLRVVVSGRRGRARTTVTWDLFDRTDRTTGETSMARTTGFPCAIAARLLAEGEWRRPGVHPPEILGREPGLTERFLDELRRRGVDVERREESA